MKIYTGKIVAINNKKTATAEISFSKKIIDKKYKVIVRKKRKIQVHYDDNKHNLKLGEEIKIKAKKESATKNFSLVESLK